MHEVIWFSSGQLYAYKIFRLEMENKQQKCKLESAAQSFERESSVDSDFGM